MRRAGQRWRRRKALRVAAQQEVRQRQPGRLGRSAQHSALASDGWVDIEREREGVAVRASVAAPQEYVWRVLTDYERLPQVAPNVLTCEVVRYQPSGKLTLRQVGASQSSLWRAQLEVELELTHRRRSNSAWEIAFRSVGGDLQHLLGRWLVTPSSRSVFRSELLYEAEVELGAGPPVPGELRRTVLKAGVAKNVAALAHSAELEFDPSNRHSELRLAANDQRIDSYVPPAPKAKPRSYLGLDTVTLPPTSATTELSEQNQNEAPFSTAFKHQQQQQQQHQHQHEQHEHEQRAAEGTTHSRSADHPGSSQNAHQEHRTHPALEETSEGLEVHLRRLDYNEGLHWRILATAKVQAHPCFAHRALTEYSRLPEVVPQVLESRAERISERRWRVNQVVARRCKMLTLRASASLDVVEKNIEGPGLEREVQFRMAKGDFEALQGKWMIQPGPDPNTCVIKYAAEALSERGGLQGSGLMEPMLECVAFEDVPTALSALAREAEREADACSEEDSARLKRLSQKERIASANDLSALEWHLRAAGFNGKMPSRVQLVDAKRDDLAEAVKRAGGPAEVASMLGWDVRGVYRPMEWWLKLDNVNSEIQKFNAEHGLGPDEMPAPSFMRRVGRRDLARAMEYHSGAKQLAAKLGLRYSSRTKAGKQQQESSKRSKGRQDGQGPSQVAFQ